MPQTLSVWCRELGHEPFYATYYGQADPRSLLPSNLDVVLVKAFSSASALAYALARLFRSEGIPTVLGGPHAKAFPVDALRFFDVVVQECDKTLLDELLRDLPRGSSVSSGRLLREIATVEERMPEIRRSTFWRSNPYGAAVVPVLSSVGCPYSCGFCTDWNNPYAVLSLERLEADLRFASEHFPHTKLLFHDPNFAVKFDAVMDVMERIPSARRSPYMIESSLSVLKASRVQRLGRTRCYFLMSGIESWTDYSNKSGLGARAAGLEKVRGVAEQLRSISGHVPLLQANLIFGLDGDRGDEPVELTKAFMSELPTAWVNLAIPTPYGATPLFDEYLASGQILRRMPFFFYNRPYMAIRPKHYAPVDYLSRLIELLEFQASWALSRRRLAHGSPLMRAFNALRILGLRPAIRAYREQRDLLARDSHFRDFHDGRSQVLPAYYRRELRRSLGRYHELLSEQDLCPDLAQSSRRRPRPGRPRFRPYVAEG